MYIMCVLLFSFSKFKQYETHRKSHLWPWQYYENNHKTHHETKISLPYNLPDTMNILWNRHDTMKLIFTMNFISDYEDIIKTNIKLLMKSKYLHHETHFAPWIYHATCDTIKLIYYLKTPYNPPRVDAQLFLGWPEHWSWLVSRAWWWYKERLDTDVLSA